MPRKRAVIILDMDGVISDTQRVNSELEIMLLREHGIEMSTDELTARFDGAPERACAEIIFREHGKPVDLDKFVEEKLTRLTESARGRVTAIEGSLDLIRKLKENHFKLAIASSSRSDFIELVLSELRIKDQFDVLTNGREVRLGKPSPDIFLLTAAKLKVAPQDCVVIEDSKNGVIAAKRAGMRCIWLNNQESFGESEFLPDVKVKSLRELEIEEFFIEG